MFPWVQYRWTSLWLMFMALGAIITFLYGFFPLKYHTGKMAHLDDLPNFIDGVSIDGHQVYDSGENSVILMVIDGLRYDFVEHMPYTSQLLKNKTGCIYVSVAEPPTVTMPRIKAMMTGSVSTFADVALNFGAPAVRGDSVVRAARARGRRSVLYGDDTWLRLFPGLWAEHDGTTSFFVTDYTEVDNNVTRHLDKVLAPDDKKQPNFDFLVLHYLGLDHIGHLEGARSQKIKPKLAEMDDVVKKIFNAMQTWDRKGVLLLCGDHGMRDAGGHGGSTPPEVLVPLVLVKSTDFVCPHPAGPGPTVAQVDLAPSIAWLLNAPPPGDSAGRILPSLLPTDTRQHLYLLHVIAAHNAKQDLPTDMEFYKQFQRAEKQFAHYLATGQQSAAKIAKEFYEESLGEMAKYLTESVVEFDTYSIGMAIVLLYFIVTALICLSLYSMQPENQRKISVTRHTHHSRTNAGSVVAFVIILIIFTIILTISCYITETKSKMCSFDPIWGMAFILIACAFTTTYFITKVAVEKIHDLSTLRELNAIDYLLISGTLFHSWSFLGTSFIEEEHMTWYFLWNTLMFFVLIRTIVLVVMYLSKHLVGATEVQEKPELKQRISQVGMGMLPRWVLLIGLHRYLRTMNQTGDRWLFLPDTADWLNAPENAFYLQAHLVIGTVATAIVCYRNLTHTNNLKYVHTILTTVAVSSIFCYRIATSALNATPLDEIKSWDPVSIVNVFWSALVVQFVMEILSFAGIFKCCGIKVPNKLSTNRFDYYTPKEKVDDCLESVVQEPWNIDDVKLSLARSLLHLMVNSMMLIIALLMRPHNVVMVPSIYATCHLTSTCMDHKMLDTKSVKKTDVVDVFSKTLVHLWIGMLFFFYQGNSNSLASVDLGAGYVGLREYCPFRVAMRMGLHAYAGPALAGALLFCTIAANAQTWHQYLQQVWQAVNVLAAHRVYCLVIYCVIATIFRHHLYVWTVFSPKLLYDFVAVLFTIQALGTIANIEAMTHITSWLARYATYKRRQ